MPNPTPIVWKPSENALLAAVQWASRKLHYSIDRPGMNPRGLSEKLDDKIMGDIATVAVIEYLRTLAIPVVAYDQVRQNAFHEPDPGWDVAIGANVPEWRKAPQDPKNPVGLITASVRSSRLPRNDSLEAAVRTRDFKIFALSGATIEQCITADIEMQVYYPYERTQLGDRTISRAQIAACMGDRPQCGEIMRLLDIQGRYGECYLTAWNYKAAIVEYSHRLQNPYWASYGKRMWFAPLRLGRDFDELAELVED